MVSWILGVCDVFDVVVVIGDKVFGSFLFIWFCVEVLVDVSVNVNVYLIQVIFFILYFFVLVSFNVLSF